MSTQSRTSKVLALSMGKTLTTLVAIVSGMVVARVLTKHDYATIRQTMLAYQFAVPLLTLALPTALYYFLPGEKDHNKRGILIDNLTLLSIMGAVFSIFLLAGGNKLLAWRFSNPDIEQTLFWMIPYPIFTLPAALLGAALVVQGKVNTLTIYNILSGLLLTISIIAACIFTKSYSGPILAQVVFAIAALPVVLWLVFSSVPGKFRWPEMASMKAIIKYSVPMGLAGMLGTISLQLDKLIVSSMCTPEEFAVYANGAIEIPLMGIVTGSISVVILADMRKMIVAGKNDEALALFCKAAEKAAWILVPAMLFLLVSGDSFIKVLFSEKYSGSVLPFRLYLLILPVRIVSYASIIMAIGKPRLILYRSMIGLALNIGLSILLVKMLGYLGAIMATLIVMYLWAVPYNLYFINRHFQAGLYNVVPFGKITKILIFTLLPTGLILLAENFAQVSSPVLKLLINTTIFFGIMMFFWNGKIYSFSTIFKRVRSVF